MAEFVIIILVSLYYFYLMLIYLNNLEWPASRLSTWSPHLCMKLLGTKLSTTDLLLTACNFEKIL